MIHADDRFYLACRPLDEGPRICITRYTPGEPHAESGEPLDTVLVRYRYPAPVTAAGRPRRAGYVLEAEQ